MDLIKESYCNKCKQIKPAKSFNKNKKRKCKLSYWCKECESLRYKEYRIKNKEKIAAAARIRMTDNKVNNRIKVNEYLETHPCIDCDETNKEVLEFDHKHPDIKKKIISRLMSDCWATLWKEIKKCDVRCANCHRIRTAKQFSWHSWMGATAVEDDLSKFKRERINKRKIHDLAVASGCIDCGERRGACLDFDHIKGVKTRNLSKLEAYSWKRIEEELLKCVVRCANCHRIKTNNEQRCVSDTKSR